MKTSKLMIASLVAGTLSIVFPSCQPETPTPADPAYMDSIWSDPNDTTNSGGTDNTDSTDWSNSDSTNWGGGSGGGTTDSTDWGGGTGGGTTDSTDWGGGIDSTNFGG